jgi:hypothetical protein
MILFLGWVADLSEERDEKSAVNTSLKRNVLIAVSLAMLVGKENVMAQSLSDRTFENWPRIMLFSTNPWLEVMGSDSPSFALYENGLVIFRAQTKGAPFLSALLSPEDTTELFKRLRPDPDFFKLPDYIEADQLKTDQPTNAISLRHGNSFKSVRVYGNLRANQPARAAAPKVFVDLFDRITSYSNEQATPWQPNFIEVMLWPFEGSALNPVPWPSQWPGLQDSRTRRRGADSYSVYLPSEHFPELKELLRSMNSGQSIRLGGRKWAISYRLPFPHEIPAAAREKEGWSAPSTE